MNEIIVNGYIARDKDNKLYLYSNKPFKAMNIWVGNEIAELDENNFKNIKCDDKLPTKVELKININLYSNVD